MFGFLKKEKEALVMERKIKAITTVDRPNDIINRLSDEDLSKLKEFKQIDRKVDPYFLQEIVDRICGPNSEEYKKAIIEVNNKFKPRVCKTGRKIFE